MPLLQIIGNYTVIRGVSKYDNVYKNFCVADVLKVKMKKELTHALIHTHSFIHTQKTVVR